MAFSSYSAPLRDMLDQARFAHLGEIDEDERHPDDAVEQHEAARADADEVEHRAPKDWQQKSAQAAGEADNAADHAQALRELVAHVLEGRGHAEGERHPEREQQHREPRRAPAEMEAGGP